MGRSSPPPTPSPLTSISTVRFTAANVTEHSRRPGVERREGAASRAPGGHQDCTALLATLLIDPLDAVGTEITRARLPRTPPTADWMRELLGMRTLGQLKQRGCT